MSPASSSPRTRPFRLGPFQFGISHLLGGMFVGVLFFTCVGGIYREGVGRRQGEALLEELGGKLTIMAATKNRSGSHRKSLSFLKPVDDAALERLAPYAQWFTQVYEVNLTGGNVTDAGLASLRKLPHLESLVLDRCPITDSALAELSLHPTLEQLSLRKTAVTDDGMSQIARLPALKKLVLSETGIGDTGLAQLAELTGLIELELAGTQVTDNGLSALEGMRLLEALDLDQTKITDRATTSIKRLPLLENISLADCRGITAQSIPTWERLRHLQQIDLQGTGFETKDFERLRRGLRDVDIFDGKTLPRAAAPNAIPGGPANTPVPSFPSKGPSGPP